MPVGAVGVASAIHVYIRQKIATVAVLRCLGANADKVQAGALFVEIEAPLCMGALGVEPQEPLAQARGVLDLEAAQVAVGLDEVPHPLLR